MRVVAFIVLGLGEALAIFPLIHIFLLVFNVPLGVLSSFLVTIGIVVISLYATARVTRPKTDSGREK